MYMFVSAFYSLLKLKLKRSFVKIKIEFKSFYKYKIILQKGQIIDSIDNIKIGKNFNFAEQSRLLARGDQAKVVILDNVSLNYNVMINADLGGEIYIGNNVIIGPNSVLRASDHNIVKNVNFKESGHTAGKINIEDNVWIASNVVVTKDVNVGKNSIVGAGSVVTKDLGPNGIYAGNPAEKISDL
jgi:acetyltransferase-like isoleucine patch superfamily enzyme